MRKVLPVTPQKRQSNTVHFENVKAPKIDLPPKIFSSAKNPVVGIQGKADSKAAILSVYERAAAQMAEIDAIRKARSEVIHSLAKAIDTSLAAHWHQGTHHQAVARQVAEVVNKSLEKFILTQSPELGGVQDPEKLPGATRTAAQPTPKTRTQTFSSKATYAETTKCDAPPTKAKTSDTPNAKPKPDTSSQVAKKRDADERIFLRVPSDHIWRKMSDISAKEKIIKICHLSYNNITRIQTVRSGFALAVKDQMVRKKLLGFKDDIAKGGMKLEEAQEWKTFIVGGVPLTYIDLEGTHSVTRSVTKEQVANEAQAKARSLEPPVNCTPAQHGGTLNAQSWIVSFDRGANQIKSGWTLFGCSERAKELEKRERIIQCDKCLGYHNPRICNRAVRCTNCGKPEHGECTNPAQCANCNGPHQAKTITCDARPKFKDGKIERHTKKQLESIRVLGAKAYAQTNPNNIRVLKRAKQVQEVDSASASTVVTKEPSPTLPRSQTCQAELIVTTARKTTEQENSTENAAVILSEGTPIEDLTIDVARDNSDGSDISNDPDAMTDE